MNTTDAITAIADALDNGGALADSLAEAFADLDAINGGERATFGAPLYARRAPPSGGERFGAFVLSIGTPYVATYGADPRRDGWTEHAKIASVKALATRAERAEGIRSPVRVAIGADYAIVAARRVLNWVDGALRRARRHAESDFITRSAARQINARAAAIADNASDVADAIAAADRRSPTSAGIDRAEIAAALRDLAVIVDVAERAAAEAFAAVDAAERAHYADRAAAIATRAKRAAAAAAVVARSARASVAAAATSEMFAADAIAARAAKLAADNGYMVRDPASLRFLGEVGERLDAIERFAADNGAALADVADVAALAAAALDFAEIAADDMTAAADALAERAELARRAAVAGGVIFAANFAALAADLADLKAKHGELVIATSTRLAAVEIAADAIAEAAKIAGIAETVATAAAIAAEARRRCGSETVAAAAISARFAALVDANLIVAALAVGDLRNDKRALGAVAADLLAETTRDAIRGAYGERAVAALVASAKLAAAAPAAEIGDVAPAVEIVQVAAETERDVAAEIADAALTIAKAARQVGAAEIAERAAKLSGDARRDRLGGDVETARRRLAALAEALGDDYALIAAAI